MGPAGAFPERRCGVTICRLDIPNQQPQPSSFSSPFMPSSLPTAGLGRRASPRGSTAQLPQSFPGEQLEQRPWRFRQQRRQKNPNSVVNVTLDPRAECSHLNLTWLTDFMPLPWFHTFSHHIMSSSLLMTPNFLLRSRIPRDFVCACGFCMGVEGFRIPGMRCSTLHKMYRPAGTSASGEWDVLWSCLSSNIIGPKNSGRLACLHRIATRSHQVRDLGLESYSETCSLLSRKVDLSSGSGCRRCGTSLGSEASKCFSPQKSQPGKPKGSMHRI